MSQHNSRLSPAALLSERASYERAVRMVAYLFSAAALVAAALADVATDRLVYVVIAAGLCAVVFSQELLPGYGLGRWRQLLDAAVLILYVSVLVGLTGGQASPLTTGYVLLIAGAAFWDGARAPALVGTGASLAYALTTVGHRVWGGASIDNTTLVSVVIGLAPLLLVTVVASALGWQRRRRRERLRSDGPAAERSAVIAPPVESPAIAISGDGSEPTGPSALPLPPEPGAVRADVRPRRSLLRAPKVAPAEALEISVRGLLRRAPEMSAYRTLSRRQALLVLTLLGVFAGSIVIAPVAAVVALNGVMTAIYLFAFAYNVAIFRALLRRPPMITVSDADALAAADAELPTYTVLVAAYREREIIHETIRALERLDYPRDRIEILLLLEADDKETIRAAGEARPAAHIRIVVVPDAPPKTKPKACNYGLQLSSGELVTIFDAEDRPEPLQLRRAAVAFSRLPADIACLQARLEFHNEQQNVITRWFSAEYVTWFAAVLPALVKLRAPVPLGGTSMHIRRAVVESVGAWDPFNVTEDADLGVRLHRYGYRTQVLDSVTLEEANSDFINWVKQRSRWYKGYLQTWLVHMRQPRRLWREIGPAGIFGLSIVIGSTPLLALLNPLFWLLTALWFLTETHLVQLLFPPIVFYPALVSVVFGNFLALYRTMVAVQLGNRPGLVAWILLVPVYWVFMSMAAVRAFAQLLIAPSFWEKTMHGLDRIPDAAPAGSPR